MDTTKTLAGQVAIVTGASKGIGAGIAQSLAEAGASVVVNYARAHEDAARVVESIKAAGGRAIAVQGDVARAEDVARLFSATIAAFERVDIVVNNAGVYGFSPIESFTPEEYRRQFDTNVLGVMQMIQAATLAFAANGGRGGSILNIGSNITALLPPGSLIYAASKCAVDGLTIVMSRELASRHIRVNSINPGPTATEGTRALGTPDAEQSRSLLSMIPLGRIGQPADIGPVAVFLSSPAAAWITGETILASGGMR
jgi:3-oxoacyl-[acyl-carrier protein] reductase